MENTNHKVITIDPYTFLHTEPIFIENPSEKLLTVVRDLRKNQEIQMGEMRGIWHSRKFNNRAHLLRKNTIFYSREFYLNYLKTTCKGDELMFFEGLLMQGDLLHYLHGFIRREKKLTTKNQVIDYFIKLFDRGFRGDLLMHKHIEDLKLIISYYE